MNPYLKRFLPFIDFLTEVLGADAEIILYDVFDIAETNVPMHSNQSHAPGPKPPIACLLSKILESGTFIDKDFIANCRGFSASGKTLKSSACVIRDNERKAVGLLCININDNEIIRFRSYQDRIIRLPVEGAERSIVERFYQTIGIAIAKVGLSPELMSLDEKISIVKFLNADGVFLFKDAVGKVASKLKVSEATLYRYIKKAKKGVTHNENGNIH